MRGDLSKRSCSSSLLETGCYSRAFSMYVRDLYFLEKLLDVCLIYVEEYSNKSTGHVCVCIASKSQKRCFCGVSADTPLH